MSTPTPDVSLREKAGYTAFKLNDAPNKVEVRFGGAHFIRDAYVGAVGQWVEKKPDGSYRYAHAKEWLDHIAELESRVERAEAALREPRLLPEGVTECPSCGATTDKDAFLLYSIDRVLKWKAQTPGDAEANAVYDAAIAEMRRELASPTPEAPNAL